MREYKLLGGKLGKFDKKVNELSKEGWLVATDSFTLKDHTDAVYFSVIMYRDVIK